MELFKKYINNAATYPFVSDTITHLLVFVNEKPMTSVFGPITLTLFCYYMYLHIRKFYPVCVNCWFCNSTFNVAFKDKLEYKCITCGQFNGFKKDGSYSKIIHEQYDQRYNMNVYNVAQNDVQENKNGLCHKCNIIQEIKIKQLASFIPTKEKNFDKEIEKFQNHLERTLKLCSRCNLYTKKFLALQDQRYNLKSIRINNQLDIQDISNWPNIFSLCSSIIVFLLSLEAENYLGDWTTKFIDTLIVYDTSIIIAHSIGAISLGGLLCQIYQCLYTMEKLNAVNVLFWSLLFTINNFKILNHFRPKLLVSVLIMLLSIVSIFKNMTKKQKIRQTSIKLEDENYQLPTTNYYNISKNGSIKISDQYEMMEFEESTKKEKKTLNKTVNNMFQGMKLNDNHKNIIQPSKLFMPIKRENSTGFITSSPRFCTSFPMKDDYEYDAQSICSQRSYRTQYSPLYHPSISQYTYCTHPNLNQPNSLNLSHSSNTSSVQQISEWPKMLMYSIPGIVLLGLQCYLLYDIKDFMKQK